MVCITGPTSAGPTVKQGMGVLDARCDAGSTGDDQFVVLRGRDSETGEAMEERIPLYGMTQVTLVFDGDSVSRVEWLQLPRHRRY